ncbi:hypothetical protein KZ770_07745 [Escherichia coli]|nr:hypothetical protein [Escherichia coli]
MFAEGDTSRYGPVNIGANTTFTLYVTKPFLGSMTIPKTDIAVIKGAWVDGMGSPSTGDFHDLVKLSIQGNLTAPQSCKINQGDVIKVNFWIHQWSEVYHPQCHARRFYSSRL